MDPVFQRALPYTPWAEPALRRLPGVLPLDPADWLLRDDAQAGQMALRDILVGRQASDVMSLLPEAREAAAELYGQVLTRLAGLGVEVAEGVARRPDGAVVPLDPARPLLTLGRLVQEDFCLLQPGGDGEHVLTGAILCFPSGWRLDEKIGRPLRRIHRPVDRYDDEIGRRVQRLFNGLRPEAPLWRANAHWSGHPLFHPRSEVAPRGGPAGGERWIRSERQCLVRLPETGAVVFSIHTFLVREADLTPAQRTALADNPVAEAS